MCKVKIQAIEMSRPVASDSVQNSVELGVDKGCSNADPCELDEEQEEGSTEALLICGGSRTELTRRAGNALRSSTKKGKQNLEVHRGAVPSQKKTECTDEDAVLKEVTAMKQLTTEADSQMPLSVQKQNGKDVYSASEASDSDLGIEWEDVEGT